MAVMMTMRCPACKGEHDVYVDDDRIPRSSTYYRFACKAAGADVAFPGGVWTLNVKIPAGAIVATLMED